MVGNAKSTMLKASLSSKRLSLDDCRKPSMKMINAFSLDTSPLSADASAFAERELRETPEQVQKSLAELRELLKGKSKTSTKRLRVGVGNDDWFAVISTTHRYYKLKDTKHPMSFRFRSKTLFECIDFTTIYVYF